MDWPLIQETREPEGCPATDAAGTVHLTAAGGLPGVAEGVGRPRGGTGLCHLALVSSRTWASVSLMSNGDDDNMGYDEKTQWMFK